MYNARDLHKFLCVAKYEDQQAVLLQMQIQANAIMYSNWESATEATRKIDELMTKALW
jgi:hypothetical protein